MSNRSDEQSNSAAVRHDVSAGVVLGVQSVPDGLATGLLAGINPLAGLYGYMLGTFSGALTTSSQLMVVQGTSAMALLMADVPLLQSPSDGERALVTLALLTGAAMIAAAIMRLQSALRFVSNAVMVGFINAVGINIILGQLPNLTGYEASGANRVTRAIDTLFSPAMLEWTSVIIGCATIALIIVLERTRIGALGLVIAVIATSAVVGLASLGQVSTLNDLGIVLDQLPRFAWPSLRHVPDLVVPAISLAFVALIQSSAVAASFPNPDGTPSDAARDFTGQGIANISSGVFQGMPVGGSVSASAIATEAGSHSRIAAIVAAIVMLLTIVLFGDVVGYIAMPSLAGLLILVGFRTIRPDDLSWVWRAGSTQKVVLAVTFALTMIIPIQYAVLVGVGLSAVLFVVRQSNQVIIRRRTYVDGHAHEEDPPGELGAGEVVMLQPYGSLFYGATPLFDAALPAIVEDTRDSVVLLRLRGRAELGTTFIDVLRSYAEALHDADCKLMIVSAGERIREQLEIAGFTDLIGEDGIRASTARVGITALVAYQDAEKWVEERRGGAPQR